MPKTVKKFVVDFWATGLHGEELGIRQKEVYRSKSQQFTVDMDIVGAFEEDGEKKGILGIREKAWEEGEIKGNELSKRLILRMFTEGGSWLGSIEELIVKETTRSFSVNQELPVFGTIIPKYKYIIDIEKARKPATGTDSYFFEFMTDDKKKTMEIFEIKEKRASLGADFNVINKAKNKKVADIDGKVVDIGGKFEIKLFDKELAKDTAFNNTLILFASTLKYQGEITDRIKKIMSLVKDGKMVLKPAKPELDLMRNPRRRGRS